MLQVQGAVICTMKISLNRPKCKIFDPHKATFIKCPLEIVHYKILTQNIIAPLPRPKTFRLSASKVTTKCPFTAHHF